MPSRAPERINFGKIKEIISPPNLIELQTNSYVEFLQLNVAPTRRKNMGLQAVFKEVFPIESYNGKCVLDYHSYDIGEPKNDWLESLREGITFGAPLYVTFLLKEEKATKRNLSAVEPSVSAIDREAAQRMLADARSLIAASEGDGRRNGQPLPVVRLPVRSGSQPG